MKGKTWGLVDAFFDKYDLVDHHIKSYNKFIDQRIQNIVDIKALTEPISLEAGKYRVRTGEIEIREPYAKEADGSTSQIFPTEARLRNLTYSAHMYLEMALDSQNEDGTFTENDFEKIYIGELPLMLKSNKCHLNGLNTEELVKNGEDPQDLGGYFIVNGSERAVVTMEEIAPNKIILERFGEITDRRAKAIVNSINSGFKARITVEYRKPRKTAEFLRISFPYVPGEIPLVILLRALGLHTDEEIITKISKDFNFQMIIADDIQVSESKLKINSEDIESLSKEERDAYFERQAIKYIGNRVAKGMTEDYSITRAEEIIDKYLLPHIGVDKEKRMVKAVYLAEMTEMLLEVIHEEREPHDKDHYTNKRLRVSGDLMEDLFRVAYTNLSRDMTYQLERSISRGKEPQIRQAVRSDVLTESIKHAIATGNWVGGRAGVSQLLDRTSFMGTLSHLRRVVSPLSRSQPHFEARDLHPTQFGKICPNETPEGPNCGLVKNLALLCKISEGSNPEDIKDTIGDINFLVEEENITKESAKIYINGELYGYCNEPIAFVDELRKKRRSGDISEEMNVTYYNSTNEIYIFNDPGRARRPLIVVDEGIPLLEKSHIEDLNTSKIKWDELIADGIVEYLDAEEEENSYIAMTSDLLNNDHTHLEIDPSTMLGICAGIIPFSDHNSSPRNTMEAGMTKQALGLYVSNYSNRTDTRAHLMHHPQTPLVKTRIIDATNYDKRPSGQNFVVAVMSFEGYNMEDSLILNKSALERGLARSSFFRSYEASERRYPGGQTDSFEVPAKGVRGYRSEENYRHLDEDGIINPESYVSSGEVLIGKTSPPRFLEEIDDFGTPGDKRRETSVTVRHGEKGVVDAVILTETVEGSKLAKIRVRDTRQPEFGDKFASRHGQKGVVGLILSQEDIPFSENGVVPDIIINPHAIPSRMSVGQVLEMVAGKAGCLDGERIDGTPFNDDLEGEIKQSLKEYGFESAGCESLYSGTTGERIEAEIFIGVAYYQKLHHMTTDKVYARSRGPVQVLTRQPTEGRAREGGLRFGEMERDCLIAHGAALALKERLLDESDKYEAVVCSKCGMLAIEDKLRDKIYCSICGDVESFPVEISYAFKLLLDELKSLCIFPKLVLGDKA
ncbi:MAG: DNA-directed RNA polymerase subunit B [Methanobrevibacter sp.]|jgi:DNA-directed RNA polymerase subunit B|nr:DNA-directed RNA polymerase subunit B [Methanobrevibacter sp.]